MARPHARLHGQCPADEHSDGFLPFFRYEQHCEEPLVSLGQILRRATNAIKEDVHILLLKTQQKRPTWGHVGSQCPRAQRGLCLCAHTATRTGYK